MGMFYSKYIFTEHQQKNSTPPEKLFCNCNRSPVFKNAQALGSLQFGHLQKKAA
jgi:hypothetical protein